jgi:membrane-associated PAP2 superfamily phosphatase
MVGVLVPAWRWALLALAAGCALTRVIAGAHFVSDCVAAGWVGYAVALGVRRLFLARGGAGPA